jgi:very-short-patch-repair endonuclease
MSDPRTRALARAFRRKPTVTEALLWRLLRDRRLGGLKFRRQVPLGRYVADFLCLNPRLVVEADGPHHDSDHDAVRDAWLKAERFKVLRFTNAEIADNHEQVRDAILRAAGRL